MDHLELERLWLLELLLMKPGPSSSWLMVWMLWMIWMVVVLGCSIICSVFVSYEYVHGNPIFFVIFWEFFPFQFCYYFSHFRMIWKETSLFWEHLVNLDLINQLFYFCFKISPPVCTAFLAWVKLFNLEKRQKINYVNMLHNGLKMWKCW